MISARYACNSVIVIVTSFLLFVTSPQAEGRHRQKVKNRLPSPVFVHTESNYTHHKGERAILYCSVKHLGTKTIIWRKAEDKTPLTIGTMTFIDDERFEVAHIEDSNDWNLMISNVSTADTGAYECQISATNRDLRKEVYLHVKDEYSYSTPRIRITGTLHVDTNMPLTLTCNASGTMSPPDNIDWFKDGNQIVADKRKRIELQKRFSIHKRTITSILRKEKAEMGDAGTYSCRTSAKLVTSVKVTVLNTAKVNKKREPNGKGDSSEHGKYMVEEVKDHFKSDSLPNKSNNLTFILAIISMINALSTRFYNWR